MVSVRTRHNQVAPRLLSTRMLILARLGFYLSFVILGVGITGLLILLDKEQTGYLSNTKFAEIYRGLIEKNAFIQTVLVNGGIFLGITCFKTLQNHKDATEAQAEPQTLTTKEAKQYLKNTGKTEKKKQ